MSEFKRYNSIKVVPFTELLERPAGRSAHKGGAIWDDWESAGLSRHFRGNQAIDDRPDWPEGSGEFYDGTLAWCGAIVPHFGHQIADFATRIPMYKGMDVKYCFAQKGKRSPPSYFWEILAWFSVTKEQVKIIDKPTIVEELIVCAQQEKFGNPEQPPSSAYLNVLDEFMYRDNGISPDKKFGVLYVSRAGLSSGLIAGESYIERVLSNHGVTVLRPETMSLVDQLIAYSTHKTLIFSEGSALHGLQLLGRGLGDLHVINRRPGTAMISEILKPRVASLTYHDVGRIICPLNPTGLKAKHRGITVPTGECFIEVFSGLGMDLSSYSKSEFTLQVCQDIENWKKNEMTNNNDSQAIKSIESIRQQLREIGLE